MRSCPKCGNGISDDRASFCDCCGCDLCQPNVGTSQTQLIDEIQPERAVGSFGYQGPSLNLTSEALESDGPVLCHKPRKSTPHIIALHINTNQFYMQGFRGVIHLKAQNLVDESLDSVVIKVIGNILGKNRLWRFRLASGESKERKFQMNPAQSKGKELIQFEIKAKRGRNVCAYEAQATLCILERIDDAKEIKLHAGNITLGQDSDKFNIGGVINVNVQNKIDRGLIRTANDVMREYEKLAPVFCPLNLQTTKERSPLLSYVAAFIVIVLGAVIIGSLLQPNGTGDERSNSRKVWQEALAVRAELDGLPPDMNLIAATNREDAEQVLRRGKESFDKGDYIQAEKYFRIAKQRFESAKNINTENGRKNLVVSDEKTNRIKEVRTLMERGFLEESRIAVEKMLTEYPEDTQANLLLAEINDKIKQKDKRDQVKPWFEN